MVPLIARSIWFSKKMFVEVVDELRSYYTVEKFGNVREVGSSLIVLCLDVVS